MEADPDKENSLIDAVVDKATAVGRERKRKWGDASELRQSAITNWTVRQPKAGTTSPQPQPQPDAQPRKRQFVDEDRMVYPAASIKITGGDGDFAAEEPDGKTVGDLALYWDETSNTYWVNNIDVDEAYQRKGIATRLLAAACKEHKTIYFSTQKSSEDTTSDTRHMTEDGAQLATAASKKLPILVMHPQQLLAGGAADSEDDSDGEEDDAPDDSDGQTDDDPGDSTVQDEVTDKPS